MFSFFKRPSNENLTTSLITYLPKLVDMAIHTIELELQKPTELRGPLFIPISPLYENNPLPITLNDILEIDAYQQLTAQLYETYAVGVNITQKQEYIGYGEDRFPIVCHHLEIIFPGAHTIRNNILKSLKLA